MTLAAIGSEVGLTKESIRLILKKNGHPPLLQKITEAEKNRVEVWRLKKLRIAQTFGCSIDFYKKIRAIHPDYNKTPLAAYTKQMHSAKQRGIRFSITLKDWCAMWADSGKYHLRGVGEGKYCMGRRGDTGSYSKGNVAIIPFTENCKDIWKYRAKRKSAGLVLFSDNLTNRSPRLQVDKNRLTNYD